MPPDEDAAAFAALEAMLIDELAPQGMLESILAQRLARDARWLERAEARGRGAGLSVRRRR